MSTGLDFLIAVNEAQGDALTRTAFAMHDEAIIFRTVAWALRTARTSDEMNRAFFASSFFCYYDAMSDAHKAVVADKLSKEGYSLPDRPVKKDTSNGQA